jgi:GTPase SAR1 family protein
VAQFRADFSINSQQENRPNTLPLQLDCHKDPKDPNKWSCNLPIDPLDLNSHQHVKFYINLDYKDHFNYSYIYKTTYNPWSWFHDNEVLYISLGILLILIGLPTLFLFLKPLWNLQLYRFLRLNRFEKIDIPGLGWLFQLIPYLVMGLPHFIRHPRTLDAWIAKHRRDFEEGWFSKWKPLPSESQKTIDKKPSYIPLPIEVESTRFNRELIEKPGPADIRKMMDPFRWIVQIVGPGGAGKTTFAQVIGNWTFENSKGTGICDHPMVPIWIDQDLDLDKNSLQKVSKIILATMIPKEEIEDELFGALFEKQRLLVILDRLSERSEVTQAYVKNLYGNARLGALIITTRYAQSIEGNQGKVKWVYPLPLTSGILLFFLTTLLKSYLGETIEAKSEENRPFSTIGEQLELGKRLADLIRIKKRSEKGDLVEEDVPLIPLHVRLFVEQAVGLIQKGKGLEDMPLSLPEIFAENLRQVNPVDSSTPNFMNESTMLKIAKILAKLSLRDTYIPKEITRTLAEQAIQSEGISVSDGNDPLKRLHGNGVLTQRPQGAEMLYRYFLDPMAEYIGAEAFGDECGADPKKWKDLFEKSKNAPGFQIALQLTRQAYGFSRGWFLGDL